MQYIGVATRRDRCVLWIATSAGFETGLCPLLNQRGRHRPSSPRRGRHRPSSPAAVVGGRGLVSRRDFVSPQPAGAPSSLLTPAGAPSSLLGPAVVGARGLVSRRDFVPPQPAGAPSSLLAPAVVGGRGLVSRRDFVPPQPANRAINQANRAVLRPATGVSTGNDTHVVTRGSLAVTSVTGGKVATPVASLPPQLEHLHALPLGPDDGWPVPLRDRVPAAAGARAGGRYSHPYKNPRAGTTITSPVLSRNRGRRRVLYRFRFIQISW